MAFLKNKNMRRPNSSEILNNLNISFNSLNITTASDLLQRANITTYPVDLNQILKQLGIRLNHRHLENDISGILNVKDQSIVVEQNHPIQRQNFTIAHEIAHFCLHQNEENLFEDKVFFRGASTNSMECQANEFAGELLMPENEFFNQLRLGNNTIEGLAKYFGVSTLAVRVRAKNLSLTGHGL